MDARKLFPMALLLLLALLLPMVSTLTQEASSEQVGTLQEADLFLGGEGGNNVLSPFLQGFQQVEESSHPLAARGGFVIGVPGTFGTWSTSTAYEEFKVSGRVNYLFWVSGDVTGTYLEITLSVGTDSYQHLTERLDLEAQPKPFNGSFLLPNTLYGNPGEQLVLSVNWRGGQTAPDSVQNNTAELWYGISSRASGISVQVDSVFISEATSEDHPTEKDTLIFKIKATSLFGHEDMEEVSIFTSVSMGLLGEIEETVDGGFKTFTMGWDYSSIGFPEGSFEVSLSIRDHNGNWWNKTDSLVILIPDEFIDLSISHSQVAFSDRSPDVGESVNISVSFTGIGKNWISVPVSIVVSDNNITIGDIDIAAVIGSNGPYKFNWTPQTPGEHTIRVVLDESAISAEGLDDSNNHIEENINVLPPFVETIVGEEGGTIAYGLMVILAVMVVLTIIITISLLSSNQKKKKKKQVIIPGPEGSSKVPIPQYTPSNSPDGFFVHSSGEATVWVDTSKTS